MSPQQALQTLDSAAAEQAGNRRFHDMVKQATEVLRTTLAKVEVEAQVAKKTVESDANKIEVRVEDEAKKLTGHDTGTSDATTPSETTGDQSPTTPSA